MNSYKIVGRSNGKVKLAGSDGDTILITEGEFFDKFKKVIGEIVNIGKNDIVKIGNKIVASFNSVRDIFSKYKSDENVGVKCDAGDTLTPYLKNSAQKELDDDFWRSLYNFGVIVYNRYVEFRSSIGVTTAPVSQTNEDASDWSKKMTSTPFFFNFGTTATRSDVARTNLTTEHARTIEEAFAYFFGDMYGYEAEEVKKFEEDLETLKRLTVEMYKDTSDKYRDVTFDSIQNQIMDYVSTNGQVYNTAAIAEFVKLMIIETMGRSVEQGASTSGDTAARFGIPTIYGLPGVGKTAFTYMLTEMVDKIFTDMAETINKGDMSELDKFFLSKISFDGRYSNDAREDRERKAIAIRDYFANNGKINVVVVGLENATKENLFMPATRKQTNYKLLNKSVIGVEQSDDLKTRRDENGNAEINLGETVLFKPACPIPLIAKCEYTKEMDELMPPTIVVLDELHMANDEALEVLKSLVDKRSYSDYVVPTRTMFIATSNRPSDFSDEDDKTITDINGRLVEPFSKRLYPLPYYMSFTEWKTYMLDKCHADDTLGGEFLVSFLSKQYYRTLACSICFSNRKEDGDALVGRIDASFRDYKTGMDHLSMVLAKVKDNPVAIKQYASELVANLTPFVGDVVASHMANDLYGAHKRLANFEDCQNIWTGVGTTIRRADNPKVELERRYKTTEREQSIFGSEKTYTRQITVHPAAFAKAMVQAYPYKNPTKGITVSDLENPKRAEYFDNLYKYLYVTKIGGETGFAGNAREYLDAVINEMTRKCIDDGIIADEKNAKLNKLAFCGYPIDGSCQDKDGNRLPGVEPFRTKEIAGGKKCYTLSDKVIGKLFAGITRN